MISQINGIIPMADFDTSQVAALGQTPGGFQEMLGDMMKKVNNMQLHSDQATMDLYAGKVTNLHEVMVATAEADLSLRMLVQFRNKAQAAYDEIMRMQI